MEQERNFIKKTYFVANDKGEVAGHDIDILTAEDCLRVLTEEEPEAGWEIFDSDDKEE